MTTLEEAIRLVNEHRQEGIVCPCCGRLAAVYQRRIHAEAAKFLLLLVRAFEDPQSAYLLDYDGDGKAWLHTRTLFPNAPKASTDGSYLVHWNLVEQRPDSAGWYRPTGGGVDFAHGRTKVPSVVVLNNDRAQTLVCFEGPNITIGEALGGLHAPSP